MKYKGSSDQNAEDERPVRDFSYKGWILVEDFTPLDDGEGTIEFVSRAPAERSVSVDNGLSATDIRGAVGGEAIPGMSNSYSAPVKSEEPASTVDSDAMVQEPKDTTAEPSEITAEPTVEPVESLESTKLENTAEPSEATEPASTSESKPDEDVVMQDA